MTTAVRQPEAITVPPAYDPPRHYRDDRRYLARLDRLVKIYGEPGSSVEVVAVRGVTLNIAEGEYVAICGHSGSGKSTLLNLLGCLDRPTSGRYILGDADVSQMDDDALSEIRSRRLGFVFQSFNLVPQLTVLENLEVPLFYQGVPPRIRRERAHALIEKVGLAARGHHRPMQLSGGQQQRVAIARALINDPLVILADEPTGNLDTATGDLILDLFAQLHKEGKTILMVTHEESVAARCRRVITMRDGQVITDVQND
jgi:putative ABC transport system ATP-binding protein